MGLGSPDCCSVAVHVEEEEEGQHEVVELAVGHTIHCTCCSADGGIHCSPVLLSRRSAAGISSTEDP